MFGVLGEQISSRVCFSVRLECFIGVRYRLICVHGVLSGVSIFLIDHSAVDVTKVRCCQALEASKRVVLITWDANYLFKRERFPSLALRPPRSCGHHIRMGELL